MQQKSQIEYLARKVPDEVKQIVLDPAFNWPVLKSPRLAGFEVSPEGETALVGLAGREVRAVALEKTILMRWPIEDIEQIAERRPGLGLTFLRVMAQREIQLAERLESLSNDSIGVRVAKSLIYFSEMLGTPRPDGSVTMRAFTHEFLAKYIGTSRELVNVNMADFRRQDLVKYSRRETTIWRDSLRHWIRMNK